MLSATHFHLPALVYTLGVSLIFTCLHLILLIFIYLCLSASSTIHLYLVLLIFIYLHLSVHGATCLQVNNLWEVVQ